MCPEHTFCTQPFQGWGEYADKGTQGSETLGWKTQSRWD